MPYRSNRKSSRDYSRDRARAHIEAAAAFSAEVGNADSIVKHVFFELSGKAKTYLFDEYERIYGRETRKYAEKTIEKWNSGEVRMSGLIAKRLFSLMPPLMPVAQKHEIVELIWKRYGPRTKKYVYIGPQVDEDDLISEIKKYFGGLAVTYPIPNEMQRKFDWLSDDDVAVKQQLLNYFMERQQEAAIASARLNVEMIVNRMKADSAGTITKMSHSLIIGNHQLEIKADPLRQGFAFSDLPNAFVKPEIRLSRGSYLILAAVVIIVAWIFFQSRPDPPINANVQSNQSETKTTVVSPVSPANIDRNASDRNADPQLTPFIKPTLFRPQIVRHINPISIATNPSKNKIYSPSFRTPGCSHTVIASIERDGAEVRIDDGSLYSVVDTGLMRTESSQWSTGDAVTTCVVGRAAPQVASINNPAHYAKVEATLISHGAPTPVNCANSRISTESQGGAMLETTDGRVYHVSSAGLMKIEAAQWRTGDQVSVCAAKGNDGFARASLANPSHYSKIQAKVVDEGVKKSIYCRSTTIATVAANGVSVLTSDNRSYAIAEDGLGRIEAAQWTPAETIYICESHSRESVSASLSNPKHYAKVQASRS